MEALVWAQRFSGILSLTGGLLLILYILPKPLKQMVTIQSDYPEGLLVIQFNFIRSIAYIMRTSLALARLSLPRSIFWE